MREQQLDSKIKTSVTTTSVITLGCLLIALILPATTQAAGIRVAVASNFLLPLKHLVGTYQKKTGDRVTISSGSTGKLYAQIVNGAPYDVFLAANSREPARLEKDGIALAGSRFTYARGKLALWYPAGDAQQAGFKQLLSSRVFSRLALANPKTAPYGAAAMSVLQKLGLAKTLRGKILRGENVSQAFQYIDSGAADLGFVALSQLQVMGYTNSGKVWLVDEKNHQPILQQAVIVKASAKRKSAEKFLAYLKSGQVRNTIAQFGYGKASEPNQDLSHAGGRAHQDGS